MLQYLFCFNLIFFKTICVFFIKNIIVPLLSFWTTPNPPGAPNPCSTIKGCSELRRREWILINGRMKLTYTGSENFHRYQQWWNFFWLNVSPFKYDYFGVSMLNFKGGKACASAGLKHSHQKMLGHPNWDNGGGGSIPIEPVEVQILEEKTGFKT